MVNAGGLRVTNADLREAFNRSAAYWNTTDFAPQAPSLDGSPLYLPFRVTTPIGPAPWTQMGLGYVGHGTGPAVARAVLRGAPLPEKPAEAVAYMQAVDAARYSYWDDRAPHDEASR